MSSVDDLLDTKSSPVRRGPKEAEYALYRYFPHSHVPEPEEGKVPSSGFSITLLGSSASNEVEQRLREEVAGKMVQGFLFEGNGHITGMSPVRFIPNSQIYYCLLHATGKKSATPLPTSPTMVHAPRQYVLTFVLLGREGLELFRSELDNLSAQARDLLPNMPIEEAIDCWDGSALESLLDGWYDEHIQYLSRVVQLCATELPVLLHIAVNSQVEVTGPNEKNVRDVKMFLNTCSLANLMVFVNDKDGSREYRPLTSTQAKVTVTVSHNSCTISSNEVTPFCSDWAQVLLAQGTTDPDPFFLRQAVENYRLKIVQDLNAFKRLIRPAESDYHALYRCYLYLCVSGNGKLLLQCVSQEAEALPSPSTLAVLKALDTFSEQSGFRKIVGKNSK